MKVLVVCEFSGRVRDAFIRAGHNAMSCDLLDTDVEGPHYKGDCFDLDWSKYDLVIAHPPCTYICVSGNRHYAGTQKRNDAIQFVLRIWKQPVKYLAIENPVGVINTYLPEMPRPQYIQPYQFGHCESKKTGLWTRNLPFLKPTKMMRGWDPVIHHMQPSAERSKLRSTTYLGIAEAIAAQWGNYLHVMAEFHHLDNIGG